MRFTNKINYSDIEKLLKKYDKPAVLVGNGINLSTTNKQLIKFIKKFNLPVVSAWAIDAFPNYHKNYFGRQGSIGNRVGNFIVQNCNILFVLGSRLAIRQISYNWRSFAKKAFIVWVDIDEMVLKNSIIKPNLALNMTLKKFFQTLNSKKQYKVNFKWIQWCSFVREKYHPKLQDYKKTKDINIYHFIMTLFPKLKNKEIIVCADGAATVVPHQVGYLNDGCKIVYNSGSASMGYELPATVGVSAATKKKKIICLAGDGSIMMNLQELQSIKYNNINVIIFLINNDGYLSIKQTQKNFFKNEHGSSPKSKLSFPNFIKVAKSFGLNTFSLKSKNWERQLDKILKIKGPSLVELKVDLNQEFSPRIKSRFEKNKIVTPELDDMYPFLEKKEMMLIKNKLK